MDNYKEFYDDRIQTFVKHYFLEKYLGRFAHIVGTKFDTISYIDGFSGPWESRDPNFTDTSFSIALKELKKAQETFKRMGRDVKMRCFFIESDIAKYKLLETFVSAQSQNIEIKTFNGRFEDAIPSIVQFANYGSNNFPFIFIDPTGWTGFEMETIAPLLRLSPVEVLVNFMTKHIRRFINQSDNASNFHRLYGDGEIFNLVSGLTENDLDDVLVDTYCTKLKATGNFKYVSPTLILDPKVERTHFHLIYGTRSSKGIEVFKDTEKTSMKTMESARFSSSAPLFNDLADESNDISSTYYNALRKRYIEKARSKFDGTFSKYAVVSYDDLWLEIMNYPLVWEDDLRKWIKESTRIKIEGLTGRERVPKRGCGIVLRNI